ncbi:MAG: PDZ domain-containing protein, partial [Clostridiales bacterium]
MSGLISGVMPDSIAEELALKPGDLLLSVNEHPVNDIIDYDFLTAAEYVELTVQFSDGETVIFEVEKEYDEPLGLMFAADVFDGIKNCANHCLFCFIDQLQPHPRSALLVKDDDYRMSFLEGNFITATNLRERDYQRIAQLRLSPLYV